MTTSTEATAIKVEMQYLHCELESAIKQADKARAEMADNLTKMGACYAVKWADKVMAAEQKARVAYEVQHMIDKGTELDEIANHLIERALDQTGYLIPSNSDVAESIFMAQGYAYFAKIVRSTVRYLAKGE